MRTIRINNDERTVAAETVGKLMKEISLKSDYVSVIRNGVIVRRGDWNSTPIEQNDLIELYSPVGGG